MSHDRGATALAETVPRELSTLQEDLRALIERAVKGEEAAKRALLESVVRSVRRTCRAVLGARHADLDDAVQDSLLSVLRALPSYRYEAEFLHYVTKITVRIALAAKRSGASPLRAASQKNDVGRELLVQSTSEDGERHLERVEVLRMLIRDLPHAQVEALLLRFVLGYSLNETAAITETPANTVKTRIRLAKQALRARIAEDPQMQRLFARFTL